MYVPEIWPDFAAFLDLLADAVLGEQAVPADIAALRSRILARLAPPSLEADYPNDLDAYFGNHCADVQYPERFTTYLAIDRYAAAGSEWGPYWWWINAGCADWPVNEDRYIGPWRANTSAPVLVVGNFFDPATNHDGAEATARLLRNSRLLSYAGWGHTAYGRSECATDYIDAYLVDGALPAKGTLCPANPSPFLVGDQLRVEAPGGVAGLPRPWPARG